MFLSSSLWLQPPLAQTCYGAGGFWPLIVYYVSWGVWQIPGGSRGSAKGPGEGPWLRSTLQAFRLLGFLRIFVYNAKPSFEITKWMAKHMLWQN